MSGAGDNERRMYEASTEYINTHHLYNFHMNVDFFFHRSYAFGYTIWSFDVEARVNAWLWLKAKGIHVALVVSTHKWATDHTVTGGVVLSTTTSSVHDTFTAHTTCVEFPFTVMAGVCWRDVGRGYLSPLAWLYTLSIAVWYDMIKYTHSYQLQVSTLWHQFDYEMFLYFFLSRKFHPWLTETFSVVIPLNVKRVEVIWKWVKGREPNLDHWLYCHSF